MSTAPRSPDVSDALARVEALLTSTSGPRVPDRFNPASVRWACLAPVWTPTLATRCGMPGWDHQSPDVSVLEDWRADGLIEVMLTPLSIDDDGQVTPAQHLFWVPRSARAAWLSRIETEDGRDRLAVLARDIAGRILAQPRDEHMPTATWRWAVVASHALGTGATPTLLGVVEHELTEALKHERPDEAWLWIEALQRVAEIAPGEATTLHQRAVRRLALFDRQRNDRAMLRDYLARPALFDAYRDLLTGPDDFWAIHYLGGGGVGKTMLMRALTSGSAEHVPAGFVMPPTVTARIDFDHINPDYPARRPGLLFAQLAEELRLKDDSLRASENFGLLFNKIALLHERVGREATPRVDIDEMLDVFRWACEGVALQRSARVVLLLDTCEELDRLGPDGTLPTSVERTFDLLERLHEKMPSLRVVLCGRRPLAGAYAGGEVVTSRLPARAWLRLHRVFAFSEEEARAYLERAAVPEKLVPAVLRRPRRQRPHQHRLADAAAAEIVHGPERVWACQQLVIGGKERRARQVVAQHRAVVALSIEQCQPSHRALVQHRGFAGHDLGHALQRLDPQPCLVRPFVGQGVAQLAVEDGPKRRRRAGGVGGDDGPPPAGGRHVPVARLHEDAAGNVACQCRKAIAPVLGFDPREPRRACVARHPEQVPFGCHLPGVVDRQRRHHRLDQACRPPGLEDVDVRRRRPPGHPAPRRECRRPDRHETDPADAGRIEPLRHLRTGAPREQRLHTRKGVAHVGHLGGRGHQGSPSLLSTSSSVARTTTFTSCRVRSTLLRGSAFSRNCEG